MGMNHKGNDRAFEEAVAWLNVSAPNKAGELVKSPKNIGLVASNKRQSAWANALDARLDAINEELRAKGEPEVNQFVIEGATVSYQRVVEHEDDGDLY